MDSTISILLTIILAAAGWWAWTNWQARPTVYAPPLRATAPPARSSEAFQAEGWGTYRFQKTDLPDLTGSTSVLEQALARAVDRDVPADLAAGTMQPGQLVPYDASEVRGLARDVLRRVPLDLELIEVDATSKTVDASKNLTYVMTMNTYSPKMNVGTKLVATLAVPPSNQVYVVALKTYNSPKEPEGSPLGAGPGDAELAPFEASVPY